MTWQHQAGHLDARALLALYPSPRALRHGIATEGIALIPNSIRALPWSQGCTIGEVITADSFHERDIATLHALLTTYAKDMEVWTAPDGTKTVRYL